MSRDLCFAIIIAVVILSIAYFGTTPAVESYVSNDMLMGRKYGRFNLPVIRKLVVRNNAVANAIKYMQ